MWCQLCYSMSTTTSERRRRRRHRFVVMERERALWEKPLATRCRTLESSIGAGEPIVIGELYVKISFFNVCGFFYLAFLKEALLLENFIPERQSSLPQMTGVRRYLAFLECAMLFIFKQSQGGNFQWAFAQSAHKYLSARKYCRIMPNYAHLLIALKLSHILDIFWSMEPLL